VSEILLLAEKHPSPNYHIIEEATCLKAFHVGSLYSLEVFLAPMLHFPPLYTKIPGCFGQQAIKTPFQKKLLGYLGKN
jgi:hypothetical protein